MSPALPHPTHIVVGHGGEEFKFALLIGSEAEALRHCEELNAYQSARPVAGHSDYEEWMLKHPGGPVAAGYHGFKVVDLTSAELQQ